MEFLSYRNFLELTETASYAGAVYGAVVFLATLVAWAAAAARRRAPSPSPALAGAGGATASSAPAGTTGLPAFLGWASRGMVAWCIVCFGLALSANFLRYVEVRHWPAQTMYEVIPLGVTAGYLSTIALYYVLGLHRRHGAARAFGDLFVTLILVAGGYTVTYVLGLDPTGKPLPPALQSYWFSTHITAYMVGYFTLFIAAMGAWMHFCFQWWRGVLDRRRHPAPKLVLWGVPAFALIAAPFGTMAAVLGFGFLAVAGVIALFSQRMTGGMAWFDGWHREADRFTWLIFVVGFPFLTAGLMQGSLWAQEAWANYWAWDSKEVSALISWLFYAIYLHLRYVAGWRGAKGMMLLVAGGLSIFITFQLFGFLPDSQKSLHRYTDMEAVPSEGMMEPPRTVSGESQ